MSVDVKEIRSALDAAEFATPVYDDGVYVFGQDQEIRLAEVPGDDECRAIILLVNNARALVDAADDLETAWRTANAELNCDAGMYAHDAKGAMQGVIAEAKRQGAVEALEAAAAHWRESAKHSDVWSHVVRELERMRDEDW
ncbi:MAG: hypothetical protein AAGE52_41820 [Myxococcota bacterium]